MPDWLAKMLLRTTLLEWGPGSQVIAALLLLITVLLAITTF